MTLRDLLDQIRFTHGYTMRLLDATPRADWARVPPAGVSHIGWQVGHLAMAAFRLGLERVRGPRPGDDALISPAFIARYGRDSVPVPVQTAEDELGAVLAVYQRVHARIQDELPGMNEADLDAVMDRPHPIAKTRRVSLAWCAQHELVHAGQIGLLRRQLGHAPLW
jgi:hypothetical protein